MSLLAFHDAANACAHKQFTTAELAKGWPITMTLRQVASIQRPFEASDPKARKAYTALLAVLEASCKEGSLASELLTITHPPAPAPEPMPGPWFLNDSRDWVERDWFETAESHHVPEEPRVELRRLVHADAVVNWLQAMGEAPSTHVLNWATATARPQLAVVPPSPFPLKTFAALVAYRAAHTGSSWADGDQREIAETHFERLGGSEPGQKRRVLGLLAKELGTAAQSLDRAIWGERKRALSPAKNGSPSPVDLLHARPRSRSLG